MSTMITAAVVAISITTKIIVETIETIINDGNNESNDYNNNNNNNINNGSNDNNCYQVGSKHLLF